MRPRRRDHANPDGNDRDVNQSRQAAFRLFHSVMEERPLGPEDLGAVTRDVLFELIMYTADHASSVRAGVNQAKSREAAQTQAQRQEDLLFAWLDANIDRYEGRLARCALDAAQQVSGLARGDTWIRARIAKYRKGGRGGS
jgi:hypothetical protein